MFATCSNKQNRTCPDVSSQKDKGIVDDNLYHAIKSAPVIFLSLFSSWTSRQPTKNSSVAVSHRYRRFGIAYSKSKIVYLGSVQVEHTA